VESILFPRRDVVLVVLVKSVEKYQPVALSVGNNDPVSVSFTFPAGTDALLDEEAAKAGIDQAVFDFAGALAKLVIGQAFTASPAVEVVGLEDPDGYLCITG